MPLTISIYSFQLWLPISAYELLQLGAKSKLPLKVLRPAKLKGGQWREEKGEESKEGRDSRGEKHKPDFDTLKKIT